MIELFKREPFIGEPFFQSAFGWEQIAPGTNWKAGFEPAVAQMIEDLGLETTQEPGLLTSISMRVGRY